MGFNSVCKGLNYYYSLRNDPEERSSLLKTQKWKNSVLRHAFSMGLELGNQPP
jgi:hypothetical protein